MKKSNVYGKIIIDYVCLIVFALVVIFIVPRLLVFFMPIIIGYVVSLFANPIVRFLEEKIKMVRKHGSALVIVLVIVVLALAMYGIGYLLIRQIISLTTQLPDVLVDLEIQVQKIGDKFIGIYNTMPKWIRGYFDSFTGSFSMKENPISGGIGSIKVAKTTITSVTNALLYLIFTIMSAYYFTAERDKIICRLRLCMPGYMMSGLRKVMGNFISIIGDYVKVQFKIMIILIGVLFVGLTLFEIKYALVIALVIGILDILPILGIGTVLIPWAVGAFILNDTLLGIELLILYIICVIIREVAQPSMFGKSMGINAFSTFFLLYVGYRLAGIVGLILSIPIGIVTINLYKAGAFDIYIEDAKYIYNNIGKLRRDINKYIEEENKKL